MDYLQGHPKEIFTKMVADILDDKPKDVRGWMLEYIKNNKLRLKKACLKVKRLEEADDDTEDEVEQQARLAEKARREGTQEIIEEDEESFGQGDSDPEPDF